MARFRERRGGFDIWPGFVDALTQLLMVVIFIVLVFTVSHFYLGFALEGRDAAVERLNRQVGELAEMLSLERSAAADLKSTSERLSVALDAANQDRSTLQGQLTALLAERDGLASHLSERTGERDRTQAELAARSTERDRLARDLATVETRAAAAVTDVARLEALLAAAQRTVTADKETIETQLRDWPASPVTWTRCGRCAPTWSVASPTCPPPWPKPAAARSRSRASASSAPANWPSRRRHWKRPGPGSRGWTSR